MRTLAKQHRKIAILFLLILIGEILSPLTALALTGGPSQPEVQSFAPVGSSDMVDLFTGDFKYNIPLIDVDGYPLNLVYNGGITMDQEASWVGLGWNLNPGVINRNLRGLPDDFNGDEVGSQLSMKPNITTTVGTGLKPELFGINKQGSPIKLGLNSSIYLNNYRGLGFNFGVDPSIGMSGNGGSFSAGLGLNFSSMDGFSSDLHLSAGVQEKDMTGQTESGIGLSASSGYNSRSGLKSLNMGFSLTHNTNTNSVSHELLGFNQTFGTQTYTPNISTLSS